LYERFIAPRPIFDERLKVFAYELLFRMGLQNISQSRKEASSSVIVDSATLFGLQTLTGHAKAFINVDKAAWRALSATATRFTSIEEQMPVCYLAAAGRASEVAL